MDRRKEKYSEVNHEGKILFAILYAAERFWQAREHLLIATISGAARFATHRRIKELVTAQSLLPSLTKYLCFLVLIVLARRMFTCEHCACLMFLFK